MNSFNSVCYRLLVLLCVMSPLHGMESNDIQYRQITLHKNPEKNIYELRKLRDTLYFITSNATKNEDEPLWLHMKGFNTDFGTIEKKSNDNLACLLAAAGLNWESDLWGSNEDILSIIRHQGRLATTQLPNQYSGISEITSERNRKFSVYTIDGILQKTFAPIIDWSAGWVNKSLITRTYKNPHTLQFHDANLAPVSTFTLSETDDHTIAKFDQLDNHDIVLQKIKVTDGDAVSSRICVYDAQKNSPALFEENGMLISSANRSFLTLSNDAKTITWYTRDTENRYVPRKSFPVTNHDLTLIMAGPAPEPKKLRPYFLLAAHANDVLFSRLENQNANTIQATVYKADGTVHQTIPDLSDRTTFMYPDGSFFTLINPGTVHFYMPTTSGDCSPMVLDEKSDDLVVIERNGVKIADIVL
jgi:hypothetical protein